MDQAQKTAFYEAIAQVSEAIHQRTAGRVQPQTHMVQAALETGYYAGGVWQGKEGWKGKNNLTGISPGGVIADYATLTEYADAYARVIQDPAPAFNYSQVLSATSVPAQLVALGWSAWNGKNHYAQGGVVGARLTEIWDTDQAEIAAALQGLAKQPTTSATPQVPQFAAPTSLAEAAKLAQDLADYLAKA